MTALAASPLGHAASELPGRPVETVRTVLKRDIARILRDNLPALALVPRDKVYDRLLDEPAILHQAFKLMRARPDLFMSVIRTGGNAAPEQDTDTLWCGRTLAECIALVVRACARRYFRRRAPAPKQSSFRPQAKPSLLRSIFGMGPAQPKRPQRRADKPVAPGERLFQAMRDFLLYDWQVALIPAYSGLSVETVTKLGNRLLDFRSSEQIHVLHDSMAARQLAEGKTPLLLENAARLQVASDGAVNAEVLWSVCQKMHIGFLFPEWDTNELRRAVSLVSATTPQAMALLMHPFGRDIRAFTLFLFTAYGKLGNLRYKQVFGPNGQTWVVRAIAERAMRERIDAPSLDQLKIAMERLLDGAALDEVKPEKV